MSLRTLSASRLVLSPLKTAGLLLGSIAVAIVIAGCSPAEPKENEPEKQAPPAAEASSEGQQAAVDTTAPIPTETVQAPKTAMSPKETFVKMLAEYDRVETIDDLEALFFKYGTTAGIAEWKEGRAEMKGYGTKAGMDADAKSVASRFKGITNIQERTNGGTAIVTFTSKSGEELYLAFTLENSQWKARSVDVVGAKFGYPKEMASPDR